MRWRTTDDRRPMTDDDELEQLAEIEDQPHEDLDDDATLAGASAIDDDQSSVVDQALLDEVEQKVLRLLGEIKQFTESAVDETPIAREVRDELEAILLLPVIDRGRALD